jgi:tetratricopeptide (TPR) repeat protein
MDPITRALFQFGADAEAFWRARPGHLLPLIAEEDQRALVVQALRLRENAADNRRPFVVFEEPFTAAATYFPKLAAQIAEHYESVRKGIAEDGVELPPFAAGAGARTTSSDLELAALAADRAAGLLGERFAGIVIALVPEHVTAAAAWRESVRVLAATRWSPRVCFAVLAPPAGPLAEVLGSEGARLAIDAGELLDTLKGSTEPSAASAVNANTKLRVLLLEAAEAQGAGRVERAAALYREARSLCQSEGLVEQEAAVLVALAGTCLVAGAHELAVESYQQAAVLAEGVGAWPLACQAWLGTGGAFLPRAEHAPAAVAFRAAAEAAKRADAVSLRIEALRLAGSCLLKVAREDEAMRAWKEAVDIGAEADVAEREASTFEDVARALVKLLERRGLVRQAQHVRALVEDLVTRKEIER